MSCSSVFFNFFTAAGPSANICAVHKTLCNYRSVYIVTTAQNCDCEFRPRQFRSVSAEPPAATRGTLRFRKPRLKNTVVLSWPAPVNHNIRVELVKAGPEKYRNKDGLCQSMIRVINVGDNEKKSCELPVSEMVLQDAEKRVGPMVLKVFFNRNIVNSSFTKVTKNNCKNFTLLGYGSRCLLKTYLRVKLKH